MHLFRRRAPPPTGDRLTDMLLGVDDKPFMRLMSYLVSDSNADRAYAEAVLLSLSENYPDSLCLKTTIVLRSPLREVRFLAAILLRQFFTPTSDFHLWHRLNPVCRNNLKLLLLSALGEEQIRYVAIAKSDTISELASILADPLFPEYPQLLPSVLYTICMGRDRPPTLVEANLLIFSRITKKLADILPERIITLRSILSLCMTHPFSSDVRVAGLVASSSLVQSLPPSEDRDKLQSLLGFFHPVAVKALADNDEVVARKVLELLIDFAGAEPNFFRTFVIGTTIVRDILAIAENDRLEKETRHLALEFVITLAEARKPAPGLTALVRKMPLRVRELFAILLEMLLDVDNGMADGSGNYTLALESLDRLVFALGGNTIIKAAADMLPNYLNDLYWKKRHAALIGLGHISQGCSKVRL